MKYKIIDKLTGKEAIPATIALKEDWAKGLIYCDMEGFALEEDGTLLLLDECGHFEYCPPDRFEVKIETGKPPKEKVYLYSMGKRLRLTAIFDNDEDANRHMENTDDAVVACFGKYVLLSNKYDQGEKP